jgi:hypothetical protein
VFDVGGNKYRVITVIQYQLGLMIVKYVLIMWSMTGEDGIGATLTVNPKVYGELLAGERPTAIRKMQNTQQPLSI